MSSSSEDIFILKQRISSEWIASNVRGPHRVGTVLPSSHGHRVASNVLCDSGLKRGGGIRELRADHKEKFMFRETLKLRMLRKSRPDDKIFLISMYYCSFNIARRFKFNAIIKPCSICDNNKLRTFLLNFQRSLFQSQSESKTKIKLHHKAQEFHTGRAMSY
jgi:hypothetical protein